MKIEDLHSSLEAHELVIIDKGTEKEGQQSLQAHLMQTNYNERNFEKKGR